MRTPTDTAEINLGPALLRLVPLEPWAWQDAALAAPGPACLCLELLGRARPRWRAVTLPGGAPAPASAANLAALPAAALDPLLGALCQPWLTAAEEAGLQGLERYLLAHNDYPGLDCALCRDQQERGEGDPDCAACPRPSPPPEALPALSLFPLLGQQEQAAPWLAGLTPRQGRLMAMRLALMARLRPGRRPGPDLPA